ncbi:MAG: hypothetical protein ACOYMG_20955 [Candidatus Methylumidiphilus sp.]
MSNIAEKISEAVQTLPEQQAAEVLSFEESLKAKLNAKGDAMPEAGEKPVTPEDNAAWVERMRAITATQPMTQTTVEDMRREARY